MVNAQLRIHPREGDAQSSLGFCDTNISLNLGKTTRTSDCQERKNNRICRIVDFAVPADHRVKLKESKKRDKHQDLDRELKKNYRTWGWRWYQL